MRAQPEICATQSPAATPTEVITSESRCFASPSRAIEPLSPAVLPRNQERPPFMAVAKMETPRATSIRVSSTGW